MPDIWSLLVDFQKSIALYCSSKFPHKVYCLSRAKVSYSSFNWLQNLDFFTEFASCNWYKNIVWAFLKNQCVGAFPWSSRIMCFYSFRQLGFLIKHFHFLRERLVWLNFPALFKNHCSMYFAWIAYSTNLNTLFLSRKSVKCSFDLFSSLCLKFFVRFVFDHFWMLLQTQSPSVLAWFLFPKAVCCLVFTV